ncbi:hypothetical protein [Staphylococcus pseudintermedius]|uniref:hypothetical protein n=1 Tax=Staphylococcus pseudintermedius TaxID=283734 RepID=UPI002927ED09|nr:hypothetical protein [Staphylococcus pseudintermedius]MDU9297375.1 hypothetical protein [Staphylococcus pseudintermedius]MDU9298925.1 hypothetical protein [Staphylococcus pseudintermedius]MDU9301636.1 hypothetical protein [Staphylococcus pseudintermedius]
MTYEYEKRIIGMLGGVEDRHFIDLSDHKNELKEVYAKAKAFDEILNIDLDQHEIIVHGQVEDIVSKYMEDK